MHVLRRYENHTVHNFNQYSLNKYCSLNYSKTDEINHKKISIYKSSEFNEKVCFHF